jgi:hypothetical protein
MTDIAELGIKAKSDGVSKASDDLDRLQKSSDNAEKSTEKLGKTIEAIQGSMRRLAVVAGAVGGALLAAFSARGVIDEAQKFETATLRMEAIIRATNGVAGRSAEQLREQARDIAWSTLESTEGIMKAQQTLLTFRNVQGDVFDRTIKAAADMSAALGGDLNSATMQLAKALENPTEGLSALSRSGTVFTAAQKEMVKGMVEAGKMAEAQAFILSELEAQYGGTAEAAAGGLAGAQDTLGQAFQEARLAIAEKTGALALATAAYAGLAGVIIAFTANIDAVATAFQAMGVVIIGLAATQLPALVAAGWAWVASATAGATATGLITGAVRLLNLAVITLGGPFGLLAGAISAAAAAFLIFRDNSTVAETAAYNVAAAEAALSGELDVFSQSASPAAREESLKRVLSLQEHAKAALAAAQAELALASAMAQENASMMDSALAFSGVDTGGADQSHNEWMGEKYIQDKIANINKLSAHVTDLDGKIAALGATGGGDGTALPGVTGRDNTGSGSGRGAAGGAGGSTGDAFAERLQSMMDGLATERETLDAWYEESQAILADRRSMELLGEEEHARAKLRIEEMYQEQLRELGNKRLSETAEFFGALASVTQAGGDKLNRVTRTLGAVQALINTYVAQTQVLADPTLGFFGKMAAYLKIGAAGLSVVSALKGGGSGGAGGGGAGAAIPAQSAPAPQRDVRVTVVGDGMFPDYLRQYGQELFETVMNEGGNRGTRVVMG